jgi:hypothetical protein
LSDNLSKKGKDFAGFLQGLTEEEIREGNEAEFRRARDEHSRFKQLYDTGICYLCNKPLSSFSKKTPCIHWLLKPKGFKKKDIKAVASKFGVSQIQSLLRWYANEEAFAKNINNLVEEGTGTKLIELTIKYKNLEWSFSCAKQDFMGHQNSQHSKHPHYHFQMRVDKRPFINFNDFHLPLSDMDVINIEAMKTKPELIKQRNSFGEGMNEMFDQEVIEQVLNTASTDGTHEEAPFSIDSFAYAEEGKEIKGDDLYEIIQEAKEKGVTVASLLHKLPNADTKVVISPGPGVVKQAPRTPRKKK